MMFTMKVEKGKSPEGKVEKTTPTLPAPREIIISDRLFGG